MIMQPTPLPSQWCSSRSSASGAGGRGFDPWSCHTNAFKEMEVMATLFDAQACGVSITTDSLVLG